jgi:AcrR family transcriptional regulator
MRETGNAQVRPYHHGDLSRALVDAARRILEAEGAAALSLRAVAREAGVSPAAPYHHSKDKTELLEAVAHGGWEEVSEIIAEARRAVSDPREAMTEIGVAYVKFARENPALYRLMYDTTRDRTSMPEHAKQEDSGYAQVQSALVAAGCDPNDVGELELQTIACWCAVHGLAEMSNFKDFQPLKEAMGGDEAFLRAVLRHFGTFSPRQTH